MLLTITTTHRPATDLGFLLHKNPARPQSFDLSFGRAHVVYPEAGDDGATRRSFWTSIRWASCVDDAAMPAKAACSRNT